MTIGKAKRPRDPVQLAKQVFDIAIGEAEDMRRFTRLSLPILLPERDGHAASRSHSTNHSVGTERQHAPHRDKAFHLCLSPRKTAWHMQDFCK
jgi:hypothetical protein